MALLGRMMACIKPITCSVLLALGVFAQSRKEIALGREVAEQIERKAPRINDSPVEAYFNRLADQIARHTGLNAPLVVHVIKDDEPRAYGLPGGIALLSSTLIVRTQTEAAMAAIIAHEVAHIASPAKPELVPGATIPLIFLGCTRFGDRRVLFRNAASDAEAQADRLGTQYATDAGYDPETVRAMLGVAGSIPPLSGQTAYVVTTSRFEDVRARLSEPEVARRVPPSLYTYEDRP